MTLVIVESPLKYHPGMFGVLTYAPYRGERQCMVGSLTGAVSSQIVTEEHEGTLRLVGNQPFECNGIRVLDCETDKSSRYESRS